jgi:hypothetical protein
MANPTYQQALLVPTVAAETADLLARFPPTVVAGWSPQAPQRQMVDAEAQALQFEMLQRALIAMVASPTQVLQLEAFLVSQGYSASDAANIASTWVDVFLEWYQIPNGQGGVGRIPALAAVWSIPLIATSTQTIDGTSVIILQATTNQFFVSSQSSAVQLNSGNSFQASVQFTARDPGTGGNVTPGTILSVIQGPAGLSVNSGTQTLVSAGRDAETNEAAVARALARWSTLGAGWTDPSFDYLIPLLSPTTTRHYVDSANPFGPGTTGVFLANAAGPSTGPSTTPGTECYLVSQGLAAINVRPNGSGQVVVQAATAYPDTITVTVKGDGSNPTLATDIANAINSLTSQLPLGPLYVTEEFLLDVVTGKTFTGTTSFQTSPGAYVELPFKLPGFGGAVGVTSIATSQGLSTSGIPGFFADVVPVGQVFVATPSVTVI